MTTTLFEDFVNAELPLRIGTVEVTPPTAGKLPVYKGVGLLTEAKSTSELGLATTSYVDTAVTKVWKDQGDYSVSGGTAWPTSANTIGAVPIKAGFLWVVSGAAVDGTTLTGGKVVSNGDTIRALVDAATNAGADWGVNEANLGYTPENQNNKDTDGTLAANSDTKYPSQKAVKTYADTKQAALQDVITANTYGSGSQVPVVTVNNKGIVTGVTTAAISVPTTFSDSTFRVYDNGDANKILAFEVSGIVVSPAATPTTKTITMPDADVNLGNLSFVASLNSNVLGGTDCRIEGGNNNNVSGTNSSTYMCQYQTVTGTDNRAISSRPTTGTGVFTHAGNGNTYYNHRHYGNTIGSAGSNCTFYDCYGGLVGSALDVNVVYRSAGTGSGVTMYGFIPHTQVTGNGVSGSPLRAVCMLQSPPTLTGVPAVLVSLVSGAVQDKPPLFRNAGNGAYHDIVLNAYDTNLYANPKYMLCLRRQVTVYHLSSTPVISVTTLGTDLNPSNLTFTVSVAVVNSYRMEITVTATDPVSPAPPIPLTYVWSAVVESTYF